MTFEIVSKYDVGDDVILNNQLPATVLKVELKLIGDDYNIMYLLEFETEERRWVEEAQIQSKVD